MGRSTYFKLSILVIALWAVYAVSYTFYGEKLPVAGGFGWDGNAYGKAARDLPSQIKDESIHRTHIERFFPSAVIYGFMKLLQVEGSNSNVIRAFEIMNFLLIMGSLLMWMKICRKQVLNDKLMFLGIIFIIVSFPLLKFFLYYPVLTDAMALLLGFVALYGYLEEKKSLLLLVIVIGAMTWPMAGLTTVVLLLFNKNFLLVRSETPVKLTRGLVLLAAVSIALLAIFFLIVRDNLNSEYPPFRFLASEQWKYVNLVIGLLFIVWFIYASFKFLTYYKIWDNVKLVFKNLNWKYVIICFLIHGVFKYLYSFYPVSSHISLSWYFLNLFVVPALQPGGNLVHMIAYFGPVICILIFRWKYVTDDIHALGAGFLIFCVANLIQGLDFESRHLIFFLPFLIYLAILSLRKMDFRFGLLILISLILSRIWYRYNTDEFVESILSTEPGTQPVHQRYFMHTGMFTNYEHYLYFLVAAVIASLVIYFSFFKRNKSAIE